MQTLYHPKFWLSWLGIGLLFLCSQLPWRWQMQLGNGIGILLHKLLPKRRQVCKTNLRIAFPDSSEQALDTLCKQHFKSLAKGLLDTGFSWWGSKTALNRLSRIEGADTLQTLIESDRPIIFLSTHFTSLEVSGSILADRIESCFVFRPHKHPVLNHIGIKRREARFGQTVSKRDIRGMLRVLKSGKALWYAPDQSFRGKQSAPIPFFGIEVPSNTATSRLASLSNALVVPIFCTRDADQRSGYTLHIQKPLNNFPGDNPESDTLRINQITEQQIRRFPEQYLWAHKRYKGCYVDDVEIYDWYALHHPE